MNVTPHTGETDAHSVVLVHHAGNPVKAEAVKLELIHPKAQIGEKETENFMVSIVEEPRVPKVVPATCAFMEIEMVSTIKHVEAAVSVKLEICAYPSRTFLHAWECTTSSKTVMPISWALSMRLFSSSGVPVRSAKLEVSSYHSATTRQRSWSPGNQKLQ